MKNLTATRGDTVKLVCEFSGDGYLKAKWLHLGQEWSTAPVNQNETFNSSSLNTYSDAIGDSLSATNTAGVYSYFRMFYLFFS